ncbi:MAG: hypothetical protein SPK48_06680, partial [Bullifex sp.]|nr:hypothetical protein [Spirochaetales bacterium]MDY5777511.1 hypothetical protein [Bullifex sp.]
QSATECFSSHLILYWEGGMPEYSLKSLVKWLRLEYHSLETISSTKSFVAVRRLWHRLLCPLPTRPCMMARL